jgi:class 3 adenylate cyclase
MSIQVINVVQSYGGDVIKFAGDAMIITFYPTQEEEACDDCGFRNATLRCATCAMQVCCKHNSLKSEASSPILVFFVLI